LVLVHSILLCYFIAVSQGHVPIWLPMISDCAVYPPESYFFRGGLISSAVLLNVVSVLMLCFKKCAQFRMSDPPETNYGTFDTVAYAFATIATLGLITVGSVNEDEDLKIHGTGAVLFFVFYLIYMIMVTYRLWSNSQHDDRSMKIKLFFTITAFISLISLALMSTNWGKYQHPIAFCEWVGTGSIILYLASFSIEFGNTFKIGALFQPSVVAVQKV